MSHNHSSQTPIRLRMVSYRYEVAESLFETIMASAAAAMMGADAMPIPQPVSPEEEILMGIMSDMDSDSGYFVRPADPRMTQAVREAPDDENEGFDKMELYTEGLLVYNRDGEGAQVSMAYDESEISGMTGAHTVLTFHSSEPDLLHLIRSGSVTTSLTFKPHHRAICVYETPYMPFEVGIHCLMVENRLLEEGRVVIDYIIEIRGAQAERCRMELTVL